MNEQLQQSLAAILEKTVSGVEAGAAFLQAEIPDVIYQLLLWKAVSGALFFLVSLGAAVLCVFLSAKLTPKMMDYFRGDAMYYNNARGSEKERQGLELREGNGPFVFMCLGSYVCSAISVATLATGGFSKAGEVIQIWLAPKIYLIEYAASLAK